MLNLQEEAEKYLKEGIIQNNLGKYKKSIESFEKAVSIDKNNYSAYKNLGNTYYYLKEYNNAIKNYEKAISINKNFDLVYYNLGLIYNILKKPEESIKNYKKAIRINKNYSYAHNNLGNVYKNLKNYKEAIKHYKKAISINKDHFSAYNNLGVVFRILKNYEKAIENYKKAIVIKKDYNESYFNLGILYYYNLKNYELAKNNFEEVLNLNKVDENLKFGNSEIYYYLAICYLNLGFLEKSLEFVKIAKLKNSENDSFFRLSGFLNLRIFRENGLETYLRKGYDDFCNSYEIDRDNEKNFGNFFGIKKFLYFKKQEDLEFKKKNLFFYLEKFGFKKNFEDFFKKYFFEKPETDEIPNFLNCPIDFEIL